MKGDFHYCASLFKIFGDEASSTFEIENDDEIASKVKRSLSYDSMFDFDAFLSSFPKNLLNDKALNKSIKELINHLSYLYNLYLDLLKLNYLH